MMNCSEENKQDTSIVVPENQTILRDAGITSCVRFSVVDDEGNAVKTSDIEFIAMTLKSKYCTYPFQALYNTETEESEFYIEIRPVILESSDQPDRLSPIAATDIDCGSIRCYSGETTSYILEIPGGCDDIVVDGMRIGKINDSEEVFFLTAVKQFTLYTKGLTVDENVFISENHTDIEGLFEFCIDAETASSLSLDSLYGTAIIAYKNNTVHTTGTVKLASVV